MTASVVVTGAGGFVGSAVVRLLVGALDEHPPRLPDGSSLGQVVALLRPGGSAHRLEELRGRHGWSIARVDLRDAAATRALLRALRPRAVLHLASDRRVHDELCDEELDRVHLRPLRAVLEGIAGTGARVVHTSSAWVLPAGERLDEQVRLQPVSPYARAKARADAQLPVLAARAGVEWINLRLFNIFGRYESESRLLPYVLSCLVHGRPALLSRGDLVRDFTCVDDVAAAYLAALRAPSSACGGVYHVGSGRGVSLREFAALVAACSGHDGQLRFGERDGPDQHLRSQIADPRRAATVLGWAAPSALRPRIEACVQWWLDRWEHRPHREQPGLPAGNEQQGALT